jgi:predicted nuclease of predicted toxin-antitoxin system
VRLLDLPLLADENIDPGVVAILRDRGHSVETVGDIALGGATDRQVLRAAHESGRVVITHDADFGALAIRDGEAFVGVIHLRPGHISAGRVVSLLDTLDSVDVDLDAPFIIVVERRRNEVRVRVRTVA